MSAIAGAAASTYLLDVEGTTTPIRFVHDVLFPHARARLGAFLAAHASEPEVAAALRRLAADRTGDAAWQESGGAAAGDVLGYALWLIDRDRKSPALKALQGRIWEAGYASGELRGEVFPDVAPALTRWTARGARVAVFSSGSVLAQRLLFAHSTAGDLGRSFAAHFDLATGGKREVASYRRIAAELALPPAAVTFVSDLGTELDAARDAGMDTRKSVRPGNAPEPPDRHVTIASFAELP